MNEPQQITAEEFVNGAEDGQEKSAPKGNKNKGQKQWTILIPLSDHTQIVEIAKQIGVSPPNLVRMWFRKNIEEYQKERYQ